MKKAFIIIFTVLASTFMHAQSTATAAAGEYYLRGVMETASGFKLDNDGTFQFFFSYGALDRFGSGTWKSDGDKVILNSTKKYTADFALLQSRKEPGEPVTIRIIDSNSMMRRHVYCVIQSGDKKQQGMANDDGKITFAAQEIDTITLLFEFCPERETMITIPVKDNNYFEFRFEPWIMEVFFENFSLHVEETGLTGKHPMLDGSEYNYQKAGKK